MSLTIDKISHAFGRTRVVHDVSISVGPGELVCVLGPSGCGKTTVLRLAAGLEAVQNGKIEVQGKVMADASQSLAPENRGVGLVFQDYALFPHLSVAENVAFGLTKLNGQRMERVRDVLHQVGMEDYIKAYPHELSGGQQQRVALARALAPTPPVMLLDEPFSGLDVTRRVSLRDTTLHVLKETGVATLMVTHDPEEAMYMADRIVLMNEGRVVQDGTPEELYFRPVNSFAAGFFGEMNRFSSRVSEGLVQTPFGNLPVADMADGVEVDVFVRPEGLRLESLASESNPNSAGKVTAARTLGRSSLVHLCSGEFFGEHLHVHARIPGARLPKENETVGISLDPTQAFVFPK